MMKRLRSYGEDLGSASGEKELDRSLSAAAAGSLSSPSSSHHRRWKLSDNGRGRPGAADDDRDRDMYKGGLRKRFDHDVDGFDDREGFRGLRKRSDHDFGNGFDNREAWRSVRKRIDHDLDGFDEREGGRGLRKRMDHDFDGFDDREGSRGLRKRLEHDPDGFDRRKGFDRYRDRDGIDRGGLASPLVSPRGGYIAGERERERDRDRYRDRERDRIHRSESLCVSRGDFPKGFRSGRDRSKREGSVSSWRRFGSRSKREVDEDLKTSASERAGNSSKSGGLDGGSSSRDSLRSPHRSKDVKSPTWSKDSKDSVGPSKDIKRSENTVAESGRSGSASEMEEGELQPDVLKESAPPCNPGKEVKDISETENTMQIDLAKEVQVEGNTEKQSESEAVQNIKSGVHDSADGVKLINKERIEDTKEPATEGTELEASEAEIPPIQGKLSSVECEYSNRACGSEERKDSVANNNEDRPAVCETLRDGPPECLVPADDKLDCQAKDEVNDNTVTAPIEDKVENAIDLEVVAEDVVLPEVTKDVAEDNQCERDLSKPTEKEKGKGVAIDSSDNPGKDSLVEQNFIFLRNDSSEGPSIRGFELFSCSGGVRAEKGDKASLTKGETGKMELEPLDLSLGLPNVSVPASSHSVAAPPNSPPRARSVQSLATTLRTGSDGFTTSLSFSGSQFIHNPSCSLTHNSVDYDCEQSVKSRPLFQGVDWQALALNDSLPKELLPYQKFSSNVNGSLHLSNSSQGIVNSQPGRAYATVLDRSGSFQRQLSGIKMRNQDDVGSPAQSAGSQGMRLDHVKENRRAIGEGSVSKLFRSASHKNMEQVATQESDFIHSIVGLVVSEPVQAMARKFPDMADESITHLKDGIREIMLKKDHNQHLYSLQGVLNNRSDLTLGTLLNCHRVQLEILVAIKTGVADFLWRGDSISSVDLAEIFLNLKCRNPNCGSPLPVDECECKFCSKKDGFCSMCMCLVCSKFDTASNTCGWVGCDLCSHWCHADCGLQKAYIRNGHGHSVSSVKGTSEMQFYCVACDHPSEMFGFVKDVFKTCAAEWKAETMLKELEYVKRIFTASNDSRGKLLHGIASELLARLKAGSNLQEIYNQVMGFLKDCDSKSGNASASSGQELRELVKNKVTIDRSAMATSIENPISLKTAPSKDCSRPDNLGPILPGTEGSSAGNRRSIWDSVEMQNLATCGKKKPTPTPLVDELENLVKIKQVEAKMFQCRADDARSEADGLKRMAAARNEKIDEEYTARIAKLRLAQVEEMKRHKLEELQVLERSHREYMTMKARMQEDIKKLLLRMEDAKRNMANG